MLKTLSKVYIFRAVYNLSFKNKSAFNVKQRKIKYRIYEEKYILDTIENFVELYRNIFRVE